jgi:1-acyl-sn-glycerol-3-phosphate acyltransferase
VSLSSLDKPWARSRIAVGVREVLLLGILGPLIDVYTRARVLGCEHMAPLQPPVIFVANHSSHMDTPVILRALPAAWRRRTAVAAAADYFYRVPWLAHVVSLAFNTVPVERKGEGSEAASGLARLIGEGWNLLLFAEGTRSRDGTVGRLHSGAAVLAAEHRVAIVPVHVSGTHTVMPPGRTWMRRAHGRQPIAVHVGQPIWPRVGEHRSEVMERVRLFFEASGAVTTPDKRIEASGTPRSAA